LKEMGYGKINFGDGKIHSHGECAYIRRKRNTVDRMNSCGGIEVGRGTFKGVL